MTRAHRTTLLPLLAALLALAATGLAAAGDARARHAWAPAETAQVHPGVQTVTAGRQCTANFVFVDGPAVYLGQAAHCGAPDAATATNGCRAEAPRVGTPVRVEGAEHPGTLVYNSWFAMQAAEETDLSRCRYNDFALVRLHPSDHGRVNPTTPAWGGPVGVADATKTGDGDKVYAYGNSSLRLGLSPLSPKEGYHMGSSGEGWSHRVATVTPGIPGDSGSGVLDARGGALGVLATVEIAPRPGHNGVTDLASALDYLHHHSSLRVQLALGTEPFRPGVLPAA